MSFDASDISNLNAIEGYLASKSDHGDAVAQGLLKLVSEMLRKHADDGEEKPQPRVLVTVSGGVADYCSDPGIDVCVFDWDNYNASPRTTDGVPEHFADLAEDLPIGPAAQRPRDQ